MPDPVTVPQAATDAGRAAARRAARGSYVWEGIADAVLEAAAPLIRADERERQRSLLPYHVPCCDRFAEAVADLINEHEDTP